MTSWSCRRASRSAGWRTPADLRHADDPGRRPLARLAGGARAGPLVVGQPGHQRHLERLLAQRGVHRLPRTPDHRGRLRRRARRDGGGARAPGAARRVDAARRPRRDPRTSTSPAATPTRDVTAVPYEKGALFLPTLEHAFGRERFDAFLLELLRPLRLPDASRPANSWTTYKEHLFTLDPEAASKIDLKAWVDGPGLPRPGSPSRPRGALAAVDRPPATGSRDEPRREARHRRTGRPRSGSTSSGRCRSDLRPTGWPSWTPPSA